MQKPTMVFLAGPTSSIVLDSGLWIRHPMSCAQEKQWLIKAQNAKKQRGQAEVAWQDLTLWARENASHEDW